MQASENIVESHGYFETGSCHPSGRGSFLTLRLRLRALLSLALLPIASLLPTGAPFGARFRALLSLASLPIAIASLVPTGAPFGARFRALLSLVVRLLALRVSALQARRALLSRTVT